MSFTVVGDGERHAVVVGLRIALGLHGTSHLERYAKNDHKVNTCDSDTLLSSKMNTKIETTRPIESTMNAPKR